MPCLCVEFSQRIFCGCGGCGGKVRFVVGKKCTQIQFDWAMMMKIYGWNGNW